MGVGWIDNIYVITPYSWDLKSVDSEHNGKLTPQDADGHTVGGTEIELDGRAYHELKNLGSNHYNGYYVGTPWYDHGNHYKRYRKTGTTDKWITFYTAIHDNKNWINFDDEQDNTVLRLKAAEQNDFSYRVKFKDDGVFFELTDSNPKDPFKAPDENGDFQTVSPHDAAAIISCDQALIDSISKDD